jgi:hypothetical protein
MRIAVGLALVCLAGCASEHLAVAPPAGVDLSGHWKLDEPDSDDPQRLLQSQLTAATAAAGAGGQTGSGGRGGRAGAAPGAMGPALPSVSALDEGLRWPGKGLSIKQSDGVVSFTTDGRTRLCRPAAKAHQSGSAADDSSHGRGDAPPPACGWDHGTLVVQSGDPEDDHPPFEQRFNLSDDRQRLIEVVTYKGGRSSGFTASRVWDRVQPHSPQQ